jgi:hypothetical protein
LRIDTVPNKWVLEIGPSVGIISLSTSKNVHVPRSNHIIAAARILEIEECICNVSNPGEERFQIFDLEIACVISPVCMIDNGLVRRSSAHRVDLNGKVMNVLALEAQCNGRFEEVLLG